MSESTSQSDTPPRKRFKPTFAQQVPSLQHSWSFDGWPEDVYPHTPERARYLFRHHKAELIAAGAVCRIGTKILFLGAGYSLWMASATAKMRGFEATVHRERKVA